MFKKIIINDDTLVTPSYSFAIVIIVTSSIYFFENFEQIAKILKKMAKILKKMAKF